MWIAVWALMGIEAAILGLWAVYKNLRERRFHRSSAQLENEKVTQESDVKLDLAVKDSKSEKEEAASDSIQDSERLTFRGYKNDWFGYIGFGSVVMTTLLFFVFLGCIVGDYCNVYNSENFFFCILI